jgi:hypothetical protein
VADNINVTPGTGATILMDSVVDTTLGTGLVGIGKIMDGTLDSTNKLIVSTRGALAAEHPSDVTPATQTVTVQDTGSSTATGANNQAIRTGTPTAGSVATFALGAPWQTAAIQVTGTWTGTLFVEGSFDGGTTYYSKAVKQIGTGYTANSLTGNFGGEVNVASLTHLAIRSTAAWTGTATVKVVFSLNAHSTYFANNIALRDATTQSITNTIKAASTAAVATDTALVATLSPNQPQLTTPLNINMASMSGADSNNGATTANTQRVTISNDSTGQVKINDGTNSANVQAIATGQNALTTGGGFKEITGTSTTGINTDLIPSTDVSGYKWLSLHVTAIAGTITFQGSNDNFATTIVNIPLNRLSVMTATPVSSTTVSDIYAGPVQFRYLRVRQTTANSGTTGVLELYTSPTAPLTIGGQVALNGTTTINTASATGSAVPANAFYQGINNGGNLGNINAIGTQTDASGGTSVPSSGPVIYNGTTYDRQRSASAATNTTGTGLLGVGNLLFDGTNWQTFRSQIGDGSVPLNLLVGASYFYNGSTWDKPRANTTGAIIGAGATTAQTSSTQTSFNAAKMAVVINISAFTSGTLTFTVNGITSSGYTYPILVSTALGATGTTVLRIFPGATAAANASVNDLVPRSFNVVVSGVFVATYGVDYELSV